MDRLFDRLGELLRSLGILGSRLESEGPRGRGARTAARERAADPLLREAQEELEEYLRGGGSAGERVASGQAAAQDSERARHGEAGLSPLPERLRQDFANLGLEPSASIEQVRRAHRRLLSRYHPDRFAPDPEKQRMATRITQLLNASFRRIRDYRR